MDTAATLPLAEVATALRRSERLDQILRKFSAEAIPTLVFKGAHYASLYYPHPALRTMCDLDLLVPEAFLDVATKALGGLGYHKDCLASGPFALHQQVFWQEDGPCQWVVDLHWQLSARQVVRRHLPAELAFHYSTAWADSSAYDGIRRPRPALDLVIAALHACSHHGGEVDHRDQMDLNYIVSYMADDDHRELGKLVQRTALGGLLRHWLSKAQVELQPPAATNLQSVIDSLPQARRTIATTFWPQSRWAKLTHDVVNACPGTRGHVIRDAVLAPDEYLQTVYPTSSPWQAQVKRWLGLRPG